MMLNRIFVGKATTGFQKNLLESPVAGVRLIKSEGIEYEAGNMDGKVWEYENPYATQEMANKILEDIQGYTYLGYEAQNVVIDPLAELADGVTVSGNYSMLAYKKTTFSPNNVADIAAPGTNEPDDEYPYKSQTDRKHDYENKKIYSRFEKTDEHITTEVNRFQGTVDEYKQQVSTFDQTVEGFRTQVGEYEKSVNGYSEQVSNFSQTVDGFRGDVRSYQESVNGYSEKVAEFSGTVNGFQTKVSKYEETVGGYTKQVSEFSQTVSGFSTTVSNYGNAVNGYAEQVSKFEQTAGKISWIITDSSSQSSLTLTQAALKAVSGSIQLSANGSSITLTGPDGNSKGSVSIDGFVTFSDLSGTGKTTSINGGYIQTDTIEANCVKFKSFYIGTSTMDKQLDVDADGNITFGANAKIMFNGSQKSMTSVISSAAEDVHDLAVGEYVPTTSQNETTFISGRKIYSPEIYANTFYVYPGSGKSGQVLYRTGTSVYADDVFSIKYNSLSNFAYYEGEKYVIIQSDGYTTMDLLRRPLEFVASRDSYKDCVIRFGVKTTHDDEVIFNKKVTFNGGQSGLNISATAKFG